MNTIGKILVILNFVFALVVGVILVFNIAFRASWKEKFDELNNQARILEANLKSTTSVQGQIGKDYVGMGLDIDKLKQQLKDAEDSKQAFEAAKQIELADLKNKLLEKDLVTKESLATQQRLVQEIDLLNKTIKDREVFINTIQADIKTYRATAQNLEALSKARQLQNEALLENIQQLTRKMAELETGAKSGAADIRNPNEPNPPTAVVNGKIERVDGTDGTLIQVTLGTDHGVNKNNTLDVYRLTPEPKYLGMIRIVDAYHQKSVARFVFTGNAAYRPQLRVDDVVTSKINR
jgi:hypothetical protein